MRVSMYACVCKCVCVCLCVYMCVCLCVCIYVIIYVCVTYVCVYVCLYTIESHCLMFYLLDFYWPKNFQVDKPFQPLAQYEFMLGDQVIRAPMVGRYRDGTARP